MTNVRKSGSRWLHRLKIGAIILCILLGADLILDAIKWPFTKNATLSSLEKVSGCRVEIGAFHKTLFPHPGYLAYGVVFTRKNADGAVTLATIKKLHCRASWFALLSLTHRISRFDLDGLTVTIPKHVPPPVHGPSKATIPTTVTDLYASGAVLQIAARSAGSQLERFDFPQLHLSNLARNKAVHVQLRILDPRLIGRADVTGSVGPLNFNAVGKMPIAGEFRLSNLDLAAYKEVAGTVFASGRFEGQVQSTHVQGRATIPNFQVVRSQHSQGLAAEFRALVNGIHGNVAIESAAVHFLSSTLLAHGSISGKQAKTVTLEVDGQHAAIQDLLRLFVRGEPSPMTGGLAMHAHIELPPGTETFLKRVHISGDFKINDGLFSQSTTEEKVDELSARAMGRKRDIAGTPVAVQMGSRVDLRDEIATLSDAFFAVPGAIARGGGTYNLHNEAIDLDGKLAMHASLSQAATGVKSILAIPLDPFFKKQGAGAVVPVRMTGTYVHPKFKMKL